MTFPTITWTRPAGLAVGDVILGRCGPSCTVLTRPRPLRCGPAAELVSCRVRWADGSTGRRSWRVDAPALAVLGGAA